MVALARRNAAEAGRRQRRVRQWAAFESPCPSTSGSRRPAAHPHRGRS